MLKQVFDELDCYFYIFIFSVDVQWSVFDSLWAGEAKDDYNKGRGYAWISQTDIINYW